MELQEVTALVALDLSAAFDTVDHELLLVILKSRFGVDGTPLAWINPTWIIDLFRFKWALHYLSQLSFPMLFLKEVCYAQSYLYVTFQL